MIKYIIISCVLVALSLTTGFFAGKHLFNGKLITLQEKVVDKGYASYDNLKNTLLWKEQEIVFHANSKKHLYLKNDDNLKDFLNKSQKLQNEEFLNRLEKVKKLIRNKKIDLAIKKLESLKKMIEDLSKSSEFFFTYFLEVEGELFLLQKKYTLAIDKFKETLSLIDYHYPEKHHRTILIHTKIADTLLLLEKYDQALDYYNKTLISITENYGPTDPSIPKVLTSIGNSLVAKEDIKMAKHFLFVSCFLYKQIYGSNALFIARPYNSLAKLYIKENRFSLAEKLLKKIQKLYRYHFGIDNYYYALTELKLANLFKKQKKYELALKYYSSSLRLMAVKKDERTVFHKEILHSLKDIYNLTDMTEEEKNINIKIEKLNF